MKDKQPEGREEWYLLTAYSQPPQLSLLPQRALCVSMHTTQSFIYSSSRTIKADEQLSDTGSL